MTRPVPSAVGASDSEPWGTLTTSADGYIVTANPRFVAWSGRPGSVLTDGLRFKDLLSAASRILFETHYAPLLAMQGYVNEVAFDLESADGARFPILVCAVQSRDQGTDTGLEVFLTIFDATETRRHERALSQARRDAEDASEALVVANQALIGQKEELRVTLRSIADAVITVDANGLISSMNPAAERLTGTLQNQACGAALGEIGTWLDSKSLSPVDFQEWPGETQPTEEKRLLLRRRDDVERCIAWTAAPLRDETDTTSGTVIVCRDVTKERATLRQLEFDASHDHLTGLFNRREFERRFAASLQMQVGAPVNHVICHIDLDQFKIVNDTAGHKAGDRLLVEVAGLLGNGLRQSDTLARIGGDEFGVLLVDCAFETGLKIAESLRQQLAAFRFDCEGRIHAVTASIGVSVVRAGDHDSREALTDADIACNTAKEGGRNRVHGVEPGDAQLRSRRGEMGWIGRVRHALDENRFELHFQPIVCIASHPGLIDHGEILLRLRDEDGRLVAPGEFIAAAERYHQMEPVDRWVLERTFAWLATVDGLRVSINLSGQSFGNPAFLSFVVDLLRKYDVEPTLICFEITETAAIANLPAALGFIKTLRPLGVQFALDDFGAGLSSFNYLKTLQVDVVKIDGGFVKAMHADRFSREIVESIHRIARLCQLKTVAEWVEDESTLEMLRKIGIDFAQGWGVGRPIPLDEAHARDVRMPDSTCCASPSPS